MKKIFPLLLGSALVVALGACDAKTASNAPNSTDNNGQAPATNTAQTNQNDASNDVRKKQIESDIRAREQRNQAGGDQMKRNDGDLESEVRGKLEANIPASELTVDSKDGAVTVAGTVPTQEQLSKIQPLAQQIKGVKSVAVKATVAPAKNK
ncbi:BON domain-containing protein [Kovacikia minuta CCNUW1]|uniref:BON domain-containing protein n=1 Tax=Kovacikia minuta TaxID=2931930 RepID=UPI001CCB8A4D|nr:BON domain-containing protein [Kovacikia minuta]UBF29021.1 BON domain-containing protein [Kovacikia minuta CCNUW1]